MASNDQLRNFFKKWQGQWKELLSNYAFRVSLMSGIALLLASYVINYYANVYTSEIQVLSVNDLILDHLPTVNLTIIYFFGMLIVEAMFYIYTILFRPDLIPFTAKTLGVFFIIRSGFIILTHMGPPHGFFNLMQFANQYGIQRYFYLNDLFFSAHTGLPFLAALLYWENKFLRYFLLGMSILQACTVLLMHVHYSIDVFSAYFITYTIYIVSDRIFRKLNLSFRKIAEKVKSKILRTEKQFLGN